jgi:virginiamycin B lyase
MPKRKPRSLALGAAALVAGTLQWGLWAPVGHAAPRDIASAVLGCQVMPGVYRANRTGAQPSTCLPEASVAASSPLHASLVALLSGAPGMGTATIQLSGGRLCYALRWPATSSPDGAFIFQRSSGAQIVTLFIGRPGGSSAHACLTGVAADIGAALATAPTDYTVHVRTPSGVLKGRLQSRLTTLSAGVRLPAEIVQGPDGNLWYTDNAVGQVARMTPSGHVTLFAVPMTGVATAGITVGPDHALWFTVTDFGYAGAGTAPTAIGRITTAGRMTMFPLPSGSSPYGLVFGPEHAVWYTDPNSNSIGRLLSDGLVTRFPIPTAGANPLGITVGSDGNLWFTENVTGGIGRLTPTGEVTEFRAPNPNAGIVTGPGGDVWFTDFSNAIYRITPAGTETRFTINTHLTSFPDDLVFDREGRVIFTEVSMRPKTAQYIGRLHLSPDTIEHLYVPPAPTTPFGITVGPQGNYWFTEYAAGNIGRMLHSPLALHL